MSPHSSTRAASVTVIFDDSHIGNRHIDDKSTDNKQSFKKL